MNYSKSQQEAIRHKDGPMLVLAGPGSGKTAVITQRTINLIEHAPSSIVDETINLSFIMSESKTYIFGENQNGGSNGMLGLLAPLLQKQGVDPNVLQIGRASCRERV